MNKIRFLRILVLSAGVFALVHGTVRAQSNGECVQSFVIDQLYCDTCCPQQNEYDNVSGIQDPSPGQMSSQLQNGTCGGTTPPTCNPGVSCSGFQVDIPIIDSNCCANFGQICNVNGDCCGGLCSSGGICINCIGNGGTGCGSDSDCCNGSCINGTCTTSGGGGGGGGGCSSDPCCQGDWDCDGSACGADGCCVWEDPILVDLGGTGFPLTGRPGGVKFDFFVDGNPIQMAWTAPGANIGWLALDRNGNGRIDNGAELFSNVAPQPDFGSNAKLGFRALAIYDDPANGGNDDGIISAADAVFSKLLVWVDKNHNGISEPNELLTMQQAGIQSISIHYRYANRADQFGNQFRYRSPIVFTGNPQGMAQYVYDVTLTTH